MILVLKDKKIQHIKNPRFKHDYHFSVIILHHNFKHTAFFCRRSNYVKIFEDRYIKEFKYKKSSGSVIFRFNSITKQNEDGYQVANVYLSVLHNVKRVVKVAQMNNDGLLLHKKTNVTESFL